MITMKNVLLASLLSIGLTATATAAEEKSMEELSQEIGKPFGSNMESLFSI